VDCRSCRRGFTLIELLTVIAIIALLAAILFPVMAAVRANVAKGQCTSNLHHIVQAAQMYKDDWKVYPDALYGVSYDGVTLQTRLFPEYVKSAATFTCPAHPQQYKGQTTLINPLDPRNGAAATEPYNVAGAPKVYYAAFDSYDMQFRPNLPTPGSPVRNYNRKWSTAGSGLGDDPRQLVYRTPPDSTVVAWCLYHSNMDSTGKPAKNTLALVAFLDGRVQTIPAEKMWDWSVAPPTPLPWQVPPKP
jgi:prepilin-type N-terminal cleavage/methylation domain-containing protein